ncbi:DUF1957 domain-containing protein, partial [Gordonia sp. (in: high G+C Gram-positive bacteria)]
WNGPQVQHLVQLNAEVVETALDTVDKRLAGAQTRDRVADQIVRETLMTVQSDWPFMVSKDTAAGYAVDRAHKHAHATREICDAAARGRDEQATRLAENWSRADNLFAGIDARRLFSEGLLSDETAFVTATGTTTDGETDACGC